MGTETKLETCAKAIKTAEAGSLWYAGETWHWRGGDEGGFESAEEEWACSCGDFLSGFVRYVVLCLYYKLVDN
jgi:hypothetical protein